MLYVRSWSVRYMLPVQFDGAVTIFAAILRVAAFYRFSNCSLNPSPFL